jgi:apolipoprotein N-acyltransferase
VWEHGLGAVGQYDKIHPVPFAEYMPERDFFHALVPDLVDLVTRDYGFGQRSNVIDIAGIPMGISICFDITDDQQAYDMARNGAEIVLAQTNNADFGHTDESLQQVAIARLRAMEMGRTVVNISTVGLSQVIAPDGSTIDTLPRFTAGAMLVDAPRSTTVTPAMAWGRAIEIGLSLIGIVGFALVAVRTAQSRRRASLFRDVTEDKPNVRRE